MAKPDSTVFSDAHRSVVPGRIVTIEAVGVLGALDGGKGFGAVFNRVVGYHVLRFTLPDVLG